MTLREFVLNPGQRLAGLECTSFQENSWVWCIASRFWSKCMCSPTYCRWLCIYEGGQEKLVPACFSSFGEVSQYAPKLSWTDLSPICHLCWVNFPFHAADSCTCCCLFEGSKHTLSLTIHFTQCWVNWLLKLQIQVPLVLQTHGNQFLWFLKPDFIGISLSPVSSLVQGPISLPIPCTHLPSSYGQLPSPFKPSQPFEYSFFFIFSCIIFFLLVFGSLSSLLTWMWMVANLKQDWISSGFYYSSIFLNSSLSFYFLLTESVIEWLMATYNTPWVFQVITLALTWDWITLSSLVSIYKIQGLYSIVA